LEVERTLSLLACEADSAGTVWGGAAKTVGARTNTKTQTICFISTLPTPSY
jgi:hypothetical protein